VFWGAWSAYSLLGGASQSAVFYAAGGCFALLAFAYLFLGGIQSWASAPALVTVEAILGFVVLPIWRVAKGDESIDDAYVRAMLLTLGGFVAFWVGSILVMRRTAFDLCRNGSAATAAWHSRV
jgi:hypothetical protein